MSKRYLQLAGLAVLVILTQPGCQEPTQQFPDLPLPVPTQPAHGGHPIVSPVTDNGLVQSLHFDVTNGTLLTPEEKTVLEDEYVECGVDSSITPACSGSQFQFSQVSISIRRDILNQAQISGKVGAFRESGKKLYIFNFEEPSSDSAPETSVMQIYVNDRFSLRNLNELASEAQEKLMALPADLRISKLEETLGVKYLATISGYDFKQPDAFNLIYLSQNKPRAFYHWTERGIANRYMNDRGARYFKEHFSEQMSAATQEYKQLFFDLGLRAADPWNARQEVIEAFRIEFATSPDALLKGQLAISTLWLDPAQDAKEEYLAAAKRFLMSTADTQWISRGIALFAKYGPTFGSSADLVHFANSPHWSVRKEVVVALASFTDDLAGQWLLRLNSDTDSDVRNVAYTTISKRTFDAGKFDVSELINPNNWNSRQGLAKALKHVTGSGADVALLRLNADTDNDVRSVAYASIQARPCEIIDFNINSLINPNNWNSRLGLARALRFANGSGTNEVILQLNVDTDSDVRSAAIASLQARPFDAGDLNVSSLINTNNWNSRSGLAHALKWVTGIGANQALLRLNADTDSDVRMAALTAIAARPFDAGDFNVSSLINTSNWNSRVGLARALRYVTGQKSLNTLIKLGMDSDSDVRAAAKASLQAHGYDGG